MAAKVLFYQLQVHLLRNFLHVVPKLPSGFNPRELVYRQMELIKAEAAEKMKELLESGADFVDITSPPKKARKIEQERLHFKRAFVISRAGKCAARHFFPMMFIGFAHMRNLS